MAVQQDKEARFSSVCGENSHNSPGLEEASRTILYQLNYDTGKREDQVQFGVELKGIALPQCDS